MKKIIHVCVLAVALPLTELLGVSAIAVSGDGSTIVTAHAYALYRHDPETLEVIKRTRFDQPIQDVALSKDGKVLFCSYGTFGQTVSIRNMTTGEEISKIEEIERIAGFGSLHTVFIKSLDTEVIAFRNKSNLFSMYHSRDGSKLGAVQHTPSQEEKTKLACISPDGKTLAVISGRIELPAEKEQEKDDAKKENAGKLRHQELTDGNGSIIYRYDIASGALLSSNTIFFCADNHSSPESVWTPNGILIYCYSDANAIIDETNSVNVFTTGVLGYGKGVNTQGTLLAKGSMIHMGQMINLSDFSARKIEGAAPNPGFPEYYRQIVFDDKGNMYGLTGADRIFRVNKELKMFLVKPVL